IGMKQPGCPRVYIPERVRDGARRRHGSLWPQRRRQMHLTVTGGLKAKAVIGAAAMALAAGAIGVAAAGSHASSNSQSSTASQGVGEAAVDFCRANTTSGEHGLGKCVSAY